MSERQTPNRRRLMGGRLVFRGLLGIGGLVFAIALVLGDLVLWWLATGLPEGQGRADRKSDEVLRA
ncbi:hypothetical protein [Actinomadura macrotermitis]|uniref:hypothetical protein n=1 Tax=Actinomadura macrotermitis TaxID=2585200 RepID=UPI001295C53E|nr:hypothetical protein [Actinomadura macrotermitis]